MTAEEIFSELLAHMEHGVKFHNQLITVFDFLNLKGYKKCHEYHCFEEYYNCKKLKDFYMKNYNRIILEKENKIDDIIPQSWYKHIKSDVDASTKRSAIRDMMDAWIKWEESTKDLLSKSYKQLFEIGEICASAEILKFLNDVFEELNSAREYHLDLEAHGYDLSVIIPEQASLYKEYQKKMKKIYEDDD